MIKAVFFDFWNTLVTGYANEETLGNANKLAYNYLKKKGYNISFEDYSARKKNVYSQYRELAHKYGKHITAYDSFKRFMFHDFKIKKKDIEKLIQIHGRYDLHVDFRPECGVVLSELKKRGYKIALVSNTWFRYSIRQLRSKKLYKYFSAIVLSCDYGFGKPDPKFFWAAAKELGVKPSECVHVGDKHLEDIYGAHQAGLACAIGIEPFTRADGLAEPIAIVKNLKEVIPIIERLNVK